MKGLTLKSLESAQRRVALGKNSVNVPISVYVNRKDVKVKAFTSKEVAAEFIHAAARGIGWQGR